MTKINLIKPKFDFSALFDAYLDERYPEVDKKAAKAKYESLLRSGKVRLIKKDHSFGTYMFVGDAALIMDIYVLPEARRSGLASQIADEVGQIALNKGKRVIMTFSENIGSNKETGKKTIEGYGFKLAQKAKTKDIYVKGLG